MSVYKPLGRCKIASARFSYLPLHNILHKYVTSLSQFFHSCSKNHAINLKSIVGNCRVTITWQNVCKIRIIVLCLPHRALLKSHHPFFIPFFNGVALQSRHYLFFKANKQHNSFQPKWWEDAVLTRTFTKEHVCTVDKTELQFIAVLLFLI